MWCEHVDDVDCLNMEPTIQKCHIGNIKEGTKLKFNPNLDHLKFIPPQGQVVSHNMKVQVNTVYWNNIMDGTPQWLEFDMVNDTF